MKKNGFTLIELLGVIVILSLLIVLAFPKIVNSIKSSGDKVDNLTMELINNAADLYISENSSLFEKNNGNVYCVSLTDLIQSGHLKSPIKLNDEDVSTSKTVKVTYNDGYSYEVVDNNSCVKHTFKHCICTDKNDDGMPSLSEEAQCGTSEDDKFYVISNNESKVTMISNKNITIDNNPRQSDEAGTITFAQSGYWWSYQDYNIYEYADIYSYETDANPYVDAYANYLKDLGVHIQGARLLSLSDVDNIGCVDNYSSCTYAPDWIYTYPYWFGYGNYNYNNYGIDNTGVWHEFYIGDRYELGIRPVIEVSLSDIGMEE